MIQPVNISIMTDIMECDWYLLTITVYQSCDLFRMIDSGIIEKNNTARIREWDHEGKLRRTLHSPVQVESRSIPRVHVEFRHFFFGDGPANSLSRVHVESGWTPVAPPGQHGFHLRHRQLN